MNWLYSFLCLIIFGMPGIAFFSFAGALLFFLFTRNSRRTDEVKRDACRKRFSDWHKLAVVPCVVACLIQIAVTVYLMDFAPAMTHLPLQENAAVVASLLFLYVAIRLLSFSIMRSGDSGLLESVLMGYALCLILFPVIYGISAVLVLNILGSSLH